MKKQFAALLGMFLIFQTLVSVAAGPGKPFNGRIRFDIELKGDEIPEEMAAMMPKKAVYLVSDEMIRIDMEPKGMGMGAIIMNPKAQTMRMMMDIPGSKFQLNLDEQYKQKEEPGNITYTEEKKTIAGYACKKALVKGDQGDMEMWYTEEISIPAGAKMWNNLKGVPMEFSTSQMGMSMKYTATSVEPGKVDKKDFEIPAEYKLVTQQELQQMMSGQGSGDY
jgi:GLPGLI family protein